jgi:hypothetical protein
MNPTSEARFADRRFAWLSEPLPPVTVSFELFPPKPPALPQIPPSEYL